MATADGATDAASLDAIRIHRGAVVAVRSGGLIRITGDDLTIEDRSLLDASTLSDIPADGVIIDLTGELVLRHSLIGTGTFATGSAGGIVVEADQITIDGGQIEAGAFGAGAAGAITLRADGRVAITGAPLIGQPGIGVDDAILEPRAGIYAATRGFGLPGGILVRAGEIVLEGA